VRKAIGRLPAGEQAAVRRQIDMSRSPPVHRLFGDNQSAIGLLQRRRVDREIREWNFTGFSQPRRGRRL